MIYAEPFADEPEVRRNHVVVVVWGIVRMHTVAGFGGLSVAYAVRKNNEVTRRIEELAWTKKNAGKLRREKLLPGTAGSVKDEYGVGRTSCRIFNRLA